MLSQLVHLYDIVNDCCSRVKIETETASIKYYMNDPDLPLYSQVASPYNSSQFITILMNGSLTSDEVCGSRPLGVNENATFVINLDRIRFDDLKADDLGSWNQNGSKHTNFRLDEDGHIHYSQGNVSGASYYTLLRTWDVFILSQTNCHNRRYAVLVALHIMYTISCMCNS